ncbi:MAG: CBS domain-containing protein [Phycisphaerae bacterium]|nr:CBS domain-containing protein [Phycisphaerae bacterium]
MAHVHDILLEKGDEVYTIGEGATVLEATQLMNRHKIGSLVVVRDEHVVGVFTERDVLRRVVAEHLDPETTRVRNVMTSKVVCCTPENTLNEVRSMMKRRKIRHLPVVDGGGDLVGVLSIGDLNAWSIHDGEVTIQYLHEYIYGRA